MTTRLDFEKLWAEAVRRETRESHGTWSHAMCESCSTGSRTPCARQPACVELITNAVGYDANGSPCAEWP